MGPSGRVFRFGLFEADVTRGTLTRNGLRVKIQDQPFRVLVLLLERPGEILTREELRQRLWPEGTYVDFDGSLNVILKKLRTAIDDDSENPRFIETVPRRGYRFISPVQVEADQTPGMSRAAADQTSGGSLPVPEAQTIAASSRRQSVGLYLGAVVSLLAVILAWREFHRKQSIGVPLQANAQVRLRKSVAVLGFHDISGRVNDEWLSTAFSEMLSTELAGGDKLRLVSGEEVANLRHASPWPETGSLSQSTTAHIGTALNSDLLISGSYAAVGSPDREQLRLDVRLQDAKTGEILNEIAETGNRENLFQLVSSVGVKLRSRLGVPQLEEPDQASVLASLPSNPEAARFYSLALSKMREYDYLAARGLFEETTKADPKFPLAYSMLSRCDIWLGHDDQARAEAKRGFDLAGGLSRVQRMEVEASYYHALADRDKAAGLYKVLFNLFPDSLDYGLQLAKLQLESYHPDEAMGTIRQLRRLPPPARDDPLLDLREGGIVISRDAEAADRLYHSAVSKASAQGKQLAYAKAEEALCWTNRQHLQSPPECQQAYEIFLTAGNHVEAGSCLQLMAEAQRYTGHGQEAIPLYERALRMFKEAGSREMAGVTLSNLAFVFESEGQWRRAERAFRDALQDFQAVNDKVNTSQVMSSVANILVLRGQLTEAADWYRQSWEIADASGRTRHEYPHTQHTALLLMKGEPQKARPEIEAQVNSGREYGGDPGQLASSLTVLGDLDKSEDRFEAARKNYEEALDVLKKSNLFATNSRVSLAELSIAEGHAVATEPLLREMITELEKEKSVGDEIGAYTSLSRALLAQRKVTEAKDAIAHAFELVDLHEFPTLAFPLRILEVRAKVAAAKPGSSEHTDLAAADHAIRSVIQQAHLLGLYEIECEARLALGELEMKINPALGRAQLISLASEARSHGMELVARHAERATNSAGGILAANEPVR